MTLSDDGKKARSLLLRLLTYRSRSIKEASDYLQAKGFTDEIIKAIIGEMTDYGYLDDKKFVDDFISYRKQNGYGKLKVRYELIAKGIDKNLIDEKLEALFSISDDLARIRTLIEKRLSFNEKVDERWFKREASFLKRRGYHDNLILTALKEYFNSDCNLSE